jgi:hypothetical protein
MTMGVVCDIAESILTLAMKGPKISIKEITGDVNERADDRDKISRSSVGKIIKGRFGFSTLHERRGNYIQVSTGDIEFLKKRYGLGEPDDIR